MATKISALVTAASAQSTQRYVIVSGDTNKQITTSVAQRGHIFYQEATAVATATIANLPGCDILGFRVRAVVNGSAGAGGMVTNIGVGADATFYGTQTVSARGLYFPTDVSARNLTNASGAVVAACPGASAGSVVVVGVQFLKR